MTPATAQDPRDIISERLFEAPREQIFRAFAEPERLARWWGPKDFRNSFHQFEFRAGGEWNFTMHGPDGTAYDNRSVFQEIDPPWRIVIRVNGPHFTLTVSLTPEDGKTRVHWRQRFESARVREQLAPICIPANEQNFDRLEAELARM